MKRGVFLAVLVLIISIFTWGVADEQGSFRFDYDQGGAMGMDMIDVKVDEDAGVMCLWPSSDVTDIVLEHLTWDAYLRTREVYRASGLASNQVLRIQGYLYDVMPAFRVTCVNKAGETERWYLSDSGEDGSLLLLPAADVESYVPNLFAELSGIDFVFSSGAGAWETYFTLDERGVFTGAFHDSEMGDSADTYPKGTVYGCQFQGAFSYDGQLDEHAFAIKCDALDLDNTQEPEFIEDGVRYVLSAPYGLEHAENLILFTPGCPMGLLPEGLLPWLLTAEMENDSTVLGYYALYNAEDESGFVGIPATAEDAQNP